MILITLPKQPNGTPGKKPLAPSIKTRRPMEPDIEAQIAHEIFTVLERLGAEPELLSIISHWRDTLDDREVFWMLREYNTTGRVPQPRGGGSGRSAGQ